MKTTRLSIYIASAMAFFTGAAAALASKATGPFKPTTTDSALADLEKHHANLVDAALHHSGEEVKSLDAIDNLFDQVDAHHKAAYGHRDEANRALRVADKLAELIG